MVKWKILKTTAHLRCYRLFEIKNKRLSSDYWAFSSRHSAEKYAKAFLR